MFCFKGIIMKGKLIVFEGIDGVGKSSQCKHLQEYLSSRDIPCILLKEPSDGPIGAEIRKRAFEKKRLSPQEEYNSFVEDRKYNVKENIIPALNEGKIVILDRYYFSTMAYQGALGIDPQKIREENESFAPQPDFLFLLDLAVNDALKRINQNRETDGFEEKEYLNNVKAIFDTFKEPFIKRIDVRQSEKEVFFDIFEYIQVDLLEDFE